MPDVTARQICTTALRLLGVAASEQPIQPDMAESALDALNSLLSSWATERLLTYTRPKLPLPLVPGKGTYTWGEVSASLPTPDLALPPPVRLEMCLLTIPGSGGLTQEWPITVLTQAQYEAGLWLKDLQSAYPEYVYLEMSQPTALLHVWTVPTLPYTLQLFPWSARQPYTHWDHVLPWPEGYQRAMAYGLAVDLAPQYEREPSATVLRIAEESKRQVGNVNATVGRLTSDYGECLRQSDIPVVDIPAFYRFGS
jgi:hypothetical protein